METPIETNILSTEQEYAFSKFKKGQNLFISGPGGSGKSYFIKHMVEYLHKCGKIYQVTSTTGCSSILLSNNIRLNNKPIVVKTIHSWSGIRLGKGPIDDIVKQVQKRRLVVKEWRRCHILIIDEISMLSKKILDTLDLVGRTVRNKPDIPFGGIQVIFLGDFFQLPPVGDKGDPDTNLFCFESKNWYNIFPIENHIEFTTIFRQKDGIFKQILNEVRCGKLSDESSKILMERVNAKYSPEDNDGIMPMKIFATRNQVAVVNKQHYEQLDGEDVTFSITIKTNMTKYVHNGEPFEPEMIDKISMMTSYDIENECKSMIQNLPIGETLQLKIGTIVMCLVNIDLNQGIANGTIGRIIGFTYSFLSKEQIPIVKFSNGVVEQIEKFAWQHSEYPNICISQIPLCLAYSNSIHKMQGATLDICEMNLGGSIFAEHQIYVALSRVKSIDGLYLTAFHPEKIKVNPKVIKFYENICPIDLTQIDNSENITEMDSQLPFANIGECAICLERYDDPYITGCKHVFCHSCILRYLQCNIHGKSFCPLCRESISMENIKSMKSPISRYSSSSSYYKVKKCYT